jgi:hypothetical protein
MRGVPESFSDCGEEPDAVGQGDAGDQAVRHADRMPGAVQLAPNRGGDAIERQNRQRSEQPADGIAAFSLPGPTEQLEARHGRGLSAAT